MYFLLETFENMLHTIVKLYPLIPWCVFSRNKGSLFCKISAKFNTDTVFSCNSTVHIPICLLPQLSRVLMLALALYYRFRSRSHCTECRASSLSSRAVHQSFFVYHGPACCTKSLGHLHDFTMSSL